MLFNDEDTFIIDYGEVRKGNNHFDIAAVLDSTIDWNQSENQIINAMMEFRKGYLTHFKVFNWNTLKENIVLWNVREIVAIFITHGVNEETKKYALKILKKLDTLNRVSVKKWERL